MTGTAGMAVALGRRGEDVACQYLEEEEGLVVLGRNWRCSHGELDVIATDGVGLVVCEVKCRSGPRCGPPLEAVTPAKLDRVRKVALCWLRAARAGWVPMRVDLVAVEWPAEGAVNLDHVRDV